MQADQAHHARGRRPLSDAERANAQDQARRQQHLLIAKSVAMQQQQQMAQQQKQPPPQQAALPQEGEWNDAERRKKDFLAGVADAAPSGRVGAGAFSVVRIKRGPSGKLMAVKTYDPKGDPIALQHLQNELALAGRIRHPNIIGPGGAVKLGGERVELTMDYADGGSLADYVKRAKYASRDASALPEAEAAALFVGLVDAVQYLTSNEVSHGDIKLGNAMLDGGIVRLIDFGTARHEGSRAEREGALAPLAGTLPYLAPEALPRWSASRQAWLTLSYDGRPADVWSLGVLLYNLLSRGEFPFVGRDEGELRAAISSGRPKLAERLSASARELLESMLQKDPTQRAPIGQVRAHPWVAIAARKAKASSDPMVAIDYSAAFAHLLGAGR